MCYGPKQYKVTPAPEDSQDKDEVIISTAQIHNPKSVYVRKNEGGKIMYSHQSVRKKGEQK